MKHVNDFNTFLNEREEMSLNEDFVIKPIGLKGEEYHVTINGHEYGYKQKEGDELTIQEVGEKFIKLLKYSTGRALNWLKKHTELSSGSAKNESIDIEQLLSESEEYEDDIKDMAVDMVDFYGKEVPSSVSQCIDYQKARDLEPELLAKIHAEAIKLAKE